MTKINSKAATAPGRLRRMVRGSSVRAIAFGGLVASAVACGPSVQAPTALLASTEATIRSAKEVDAHGDVRTAFLVQLAEEEVALAKNRMHEGNHRRAELLLQRAISDAELAIALTRENVAKAEARKARQLLNAKAARGARAAPEE